MAEIKDGSLELEIIRMQADSKVQEQVSKSKVEIQANLDDLLGVRYRETLQGRGRAGIGDIGGPVVDPVPLGLALHDLLQRQPVPPGVPR